MMKKALLLPPRVARLMSLAGKLHGRRTGLSQELSVDEHIALAGFALNYGDIIHHFHQIDKVELNFRLDPPSTSESVLRLYQAELAINPWGIAISHRIQFQQQRQTLVAPRDRKSLDTISVGDDSIVPVVLKHCGLPVFLRSQDCLACAEPLGFNDFDEAQSSLEVHTVKSHGKEGRHCQNRWDEIVRKYRAVMEILLPLQYGYDLKAFEQVDIADLQGKVNESYLSMAHLLERPYRSRLMLLPGRSDKLSVLIFDCLRGLYPLETLWRIPVIKTPDNSKARLTLYEATYSPLPAGRLIPVSHLELDPAYTQGFSTPG